MIVTSTNSSLPIASNVVIGTNVFTNVGASYVDFFGLYKLIEIIIYWNILIPMRNVTFDL